MRSIAAIAALVLSLLHATGARASPFVTLRWTNPRFQAAVDDSGNAYCEDSRDTLRTLHSIEIWGQPNYGGGFKKLVAVYVMGREGLVDTAQVDRVYNWAGWHYYVIPVGLNGIKAPCPSNMVYIPGSQVTGVDPSPLIVAEAVWFDVRGRRVEPKDSGVYFLVWKVRGGLQKPGHKVVFVDGRRLTPLPLPRF